MSSLTHSPAANSRPAINPWVIALVVVVPTFMEILDTSIANVALRYIAGGLAAAVTDSKWVITGYLAANAIVLPLTGWLSARLGRRNYFLLSLAGFTLASAMCAMATSLPMLILFRVIQGLAAGGLQPCSQGILLDTFPPEKHGTAMTLFAIAAVIGPIVGPTLGGWILVNYEWRWVFLVNVPLGLLVLVAAYAVLDDPEYLKQERAKLLRRPLNFDFIGLGLLVLVIASWEVVLSKGQEWDWLGDPFGRVQTLMILFVLGLGSLIVWEMRTAEPIINFRVLRERNLAVSCVIMFLAFAVLYGSNATLPGMLQSLFGYDALQSGLVMSPSGVTSLIAMVIAGILMGRRVDARWLVAAGLIVMAAASFWMSQMNLQISPGQVAAPRMLLTLGVGLLFAPISTAAYLYTPIHLRGAAVGLASLLRTEGGSVGTSMAQTVQERRMQFHTERMGEFLDPLNPQVHSFLEQSRALLYQQTGDADAAYYMALETLANLRQQQAVSMAYFDVFWLCAVLAAALVVLVLLLKRSVTDKAEHKGSD